VFIVVCFVIDSVRKLLDTPSYAWIVLVEYIKGRIRWEGITCGWEDTIRMDFREIGWECVHWMHLDQDRNQWQALTNTVMNIWVP